MWLYTLIPVAYYKITAPNAQISLYLEVLVPSTYSGGKYLIEPSYDARIAYLLYFFAIVKSIILTCKSLPQLPQLSMIMLDGFIFEWMILTRCKY